MPKLATGREFLLEDIRYIQKTISNLAWHRDLLQKGEDYHSILNIERHKHMKHLDAEQSIAELQKQLDELKTSLEKKDPEELLWKPKAGENYYYYVDGCNKAVLDWSDRSTNYNLRQEANNIFQTKEAAEKHSRRLKLINKLFRLADALNDGWVPDWDDEDQEKYNLWLDPYTNKFCVFSHRLNKVGVPYFKSYESAERAITYLTDEDKQIVRECF